MDPWKCKGKPNIFRVAEEVSWPPTEFSPAKLLSTNITRMISLYF